MNWKSFIIGVAIGLLVALFGLFLTDEFRDKVIPLSGSPFYPAIKVNKWSGESWFFKGSADNPAWIKIHPE